MCTSFAEALGLILVAGLVLAQECSNVLVVLLLRLKYNLNIQLPEVYLITLISSAFEKWLELN